MIHTKFQTKLSRFAKILAVNAQLQNNPFLLSVFSRTVRSEWLQMNMLENRAAHTSHKLCSYLVLSSS